MPLTLVGIDEAGYGPLLGPLCVGMAAFRVEAWTPGQPAPDLWRLLAAGVTKKPGDKRRRVAVDDSKRLKLANDSLTRHPLTHLERGVLAHLACLPDWPGAAASAADGAAERNPCRPATDRELLAALGAWPAEALPPHPWYDVAPAPCPAAGDAASNVIAGNMLAGAMREAGAACVALRCRMLDESEFNAVVRESGSKAAACARAVQEHLAAAWRDWAVVEGLGEHDGPRVVCDRQGGRANYERFLGAACPGAAVRTLELDDRVSRYELSGRGADGRARRMFVSFQVEADSGFLPVALASMAAKLVRETCMARFNRYWSARAAAGGVEVKPTAGYTQDARRWLEEMRDLLDGPTRAALVRIA